MVVTLAQAEAWGGVVPWDRAAAEPQAHCWHRRLQLRAHLQLRHTSQIGLGFNLVDAALHEITHALGVLFRRHVAGDLHRAGKLLAAGDTRAALFFP